MKKSIALCAGLCALLVFTGCKSKESAYRKAYDKAKAAEAAEQTYTTQQQQYTPVTETPVVTPIQERPVTQNRVVDNNDNVPVRTESVSVVSGSGLKGYSVVVGSFSVLANAQSMQNRLKNAGYDAQVVKNNDRNMYRVVATTFTYKDDAVRSRDAFRSQYPDAWLLYSK